MRRQVKELISKLIDWLLSEQDAIKEKDVREVWYCPSCEVFSMSSESDISDGTGYCGNCGDHKLMHAVLADLGEVE